MLCKFICGNILNLKILKLRFKPKAQEKVRTRGGAIPARRQ